MYTGDCQLSLSDINGAEQINNIGHRLFILVECLYIAYIPQDFTPLSFNILINNAPVVSIYLESSYLQISA